MKLSRTMMMVLIVAGALCASAPVKKGPVVRAAPEPYPDPAVIARSNNAFACALYTKLAEDQGNLFFSPSSIHTALAMTQAGARGGTLQQMYRVLALPTAHVDRPAHSHTRDHVERGAPAPPSLEIRLWAPDVVARAYEGLLERLKPGKKAGYKLHVANALWGQKGYPWLEEFLKVTKENYGAGLREVDFVEDTEDAREAINEWVEEQTKEKIKDLLQKGILTRDTRLVLTNAIYFKGDWASQFEKKATKDAPFKLSGDKSIDVPMMYQKADFGYAEDKTLQALSMPYEGKDLSMVVLLPREADGLAALEKSLSAGKLNSRLRKLARREVRVYLPRFKMTSQFRLAETLAAMGMKDAFTLGKADFSGMNGRKDLFISAVVHKAFVDVNEKGTEAAAATGVAIAPMEAPAPAPVFRADHPFLFLIRHEKTGAILFMGRVANPKE